MTSPTDAKPRWLGLYVLIAVLAIIAALVIVILNGHDVNLLVAALVAIIPLVTGVGVLVKQGDAHQEDRTRTGGTAK